MSINFINTSRSIILPFLWCSIIGIYFLYPISVNADGELLIEPSVQHVELQEGDAVSRQSITITNNSLKTIELEIFALNIQQTNEQGAVAFVDRPLNTDSFTLADFIEITEPIVSIDPGQKKEVAFSVINSTDLTPGGHYAALIARYRQENNTGKQLILPAVSTFVITSKKGGERYHVSLLAIKDLQQAIRFHVPKKLSLTFSNDGNIHHTPRGSILIKDIFGRQTHKAIINDGSVIVLPKNRRSIEVEVKQQLPVLPIMFYTAEIAGRTDPGDVPFSQKESMVVINPLVFPFLLIVTGFIVLTLYLYRKKYQHRHGITK